MGARLKANFGFMFSFTGRSLFILFCGTIAFALNHWLGYLFGALTFRECGRGVGQLVAARAAAACGSECYHVRTGTPISALRRCPAPAPAPRRMQ